MAADPLVYEAFRMPAFPCNPRPFLHGLLAHLEDGDIADDEAKKILWVLMAMSYGQLARIDLYDEYRRLDT